VINEDINTFGDKMNVLNIDNVDDYICEKNIITVDKNYFK